MVIFIKGIVQKAHFNHAACRQVEQLYIAHWLLAQGGCYSVAPSLSYWFHLRFGSTGAEKKNGDTSLDELQNLLLYNTQQIGIGDFSDSAV